jgi:GTP cyclohydrolase I
MSGAVDRPSAERAIADFLRALGRDPDKEPELQHTAARVTAAFVERLCAGYTQDPLELLRKHAIDGVTGEVVVRGIPVLTTCPHHLMLATGTATVGFLARGRGVGLGAIADVVRASSRRLVLQEEIGEHVCDAIAKVLDPAWVFCRIALVHGCMRVADDALTATEVETTAVRGNVPAEGLGRRAAP